MLNGEARRVPSRIFHMVPFNGKHTMLAALITHVAAYVDAVIVVEEKMTASFVIPKHASVDVLHVVVQNISAFNDRRDNATSESFAKELSQRRAGLAVIQKVFAADDRDVVILGDVNELPPLKYLPLLRHCNIAPRKMSSIGDNKIQFMDFQANYWLLPMRSFFYNFCCVGTEGRKGLSFVMAAHVGFLRLHLATALMCSRTPQCPLIIPDDAATLKYGWHLSFFMSPDEILRKIQPGRSTTTLSNVEESVATCRHIFNETSDDDNVVALRWVPNGTAFNVIPAAAREAFGEC